MADASQTQNPNMVPQGEEAGVGFMDYALAPVNAIWNGYSELLATGADLLGADRTAADIRADKGDIRDYFSKLGDRIANGVEDAYINTRYPNIGNMKEQYPDVFDRLEARMDENGNLDGESLQRLESLIAQNPENAHEVFSTIQNNPEFLELAGDVDTMMTPETMEQIFQNPELLQVHHLSQLQQQYPEVFADLRTSMTSDGPVDLEQMHALEQIIAQDPDNATQVFNTLQANPELLTMGGAMGGMMTAENIDAIFKNPELLNVDQIMQLKQEFPGVFEKLETTMEKNGPLNLEQLHKLETAIEQNPENAREIMQTFKDNPEFADYAFKQFGDRIGNGGFEEVIRNPEMVTNGAEMFQLTQNMGVELKALVGSFMTNGELNLQNFDFENFFEGLIQLFSNFLEGAGTIVDGSDMDLAQFAQSSFNLSGLEDKLEQATSPTPQQPAPQQQAPQQPSPQQQPPAGAAPGD